MFSALAAATISVVPSRAISARPASIAPGASSSPPPKVKMTSPVIRGLDSCRMSRANAAAPVRAAAESRAWVVRTRAGTKYRYFIFMDNFKSAAPPSVTVTSLVWVPSFSCHTSTVYLPAGTSLMVKLPSSPETAK